MKNNHRNDDDLLDDLDELVANAARGDGRAVGAIAIAFGPMLLAVARVELGAAHAADDADVLQKKHPDDLQNADLEPLHQ